MSELIDRRLKVLADALDGCPLTYPCDKLWSPEGWCKDHCKAGQQEPDAECWLRYAEVMVEEAKNSKESSLTQNALDTISRQAAIDVLGVGKKVLSRVLDDTDDVVGCEREKYSWGLGLIEAYINDMKELPPAQSDIIRCNACKHWTQTAGNMPGFGLGDCDYLNAKLVNCNGYCYWAERREE